MTVLEGFMPIGPFKQEFHEPMGFDHIIPSNGPPKPRRPQMPLKPLEDYRFFVALVAVEDGTVQMRASQELKGYKRLILEDAVLKFNEVLADYIQQPGSSKRHRSLTQASNCFLPRDSPPNPRKTAKRRHHPAFHGLEQPFYVRQELKLDGKQPVQAVRQLQIRVDDQNAQAKWFSDAFKAVQQVGCRTIAKVWIKKIHPKKQSTHPYNGGFPRDQEADPDRTRPPYWPADVIHKEPDHIDRNARTALLVHLIMNTPQPQIKSPQDSDTMITAQDLFAALEEKRNDFKLDRWSIISDIVKAREEIEIFESGGFDGDTIIHVPDLSERSARGDLDGEGDDNDVSATEQVSTGVVSEDGHDEDNEARPAGSATASPTGLVPGEKSQTGHRHSGQSNADVERNMRNQSVAHHVSNTFSTTMDDYAQAAAEQNCSAMTVDSHPFGGQPKPDRAAPRLHHINMPHDLTGYPSHSSRQHQEALAHQWLATESPTGYVSNGYGLDNLHSHTPISAQSFDASLLHGNMQEMNIPNGLPMMDGMSYDEFPPHSRTLPVRAMSTPHPIMLDQVVHGAHGLEVIQPAFYTN